jgi:hypothetical protein
MQTNELKEMATTPSLVEALQAVDPKAVASLKQIMAIISQANGSSNGRVDVPSMNVTFDEPSLRGVFSSTIITHLRIMGRGFKWAIPVLVSINKVLRLCSTTKKIFIR